MLLSIENPPPAADPNHEISLKGVDLSNSTLDDHSPVPSFSIRDYVFNARNKDIKTNWPFSQKNLQLCLKHGVKDILPPFQCLDCIKNRCNERGSAKSSSSEKGNIINSDGEPSSEDGNIDFSDKQLLDNSNNPCPQEVFTKTSERPESHLPKKPEVSKLPSMKKCKLIVKVGPSGVQPSSNLHGASTTVEPMAASKRCPVCKTFSSSSNTTLNAHIDQCLAMDSPIEPSSKSRVIKRRIKPRKTRLVVDIYATAPHCTLEELDWRNGRIWSEKPTLPTNQEDAVDCGEEKKQSDCFVKKGNEGAVYVDTNGTKLRILNKISDTTLGQKLGANPRRLGKHLRGGKESKPLSTYKKKEKHSKYLKLASPKQRTCYYKTRLASRVLRDREKDVHVEDSHNKDENMDVNVAQCLKSRERIINSGTVNSKWASSKRTDLLKRQFEGDQSSSPESDLESSYAEKINNCSEIPRLSLQKRKGIDNSCKGPINEYHEQPPLKKHLVFKSFRSQSAASVDRTFSVDQSNSWEPKMSKNSPLRAKNSDKYFEKHLAHHRRIDEGASQVPLKRSTILRIRKKKSSSSISHRNELTKDRGNRENPPPRVGALLEDGLVNVEPPHGGEVVIEQSSGTGAESVMRLTGSFDQDFYLIGDTGMETGMGPTDLQGSYFSGVDPITIPGPPGSFLPSPGRMSTDEDHQGNSSLTTNRLQSSVDHLEMVNRDLSNSPKSANSTISNSLVARSDLKSIEDLSLESRDETTKLGFSNEISKSTFGSQDGQACCCSDKKGVSVNYRESQLLSQSAMSFFPAYTLDKQPSFYPNSAIPIAESGLDLVSVKVPIKPSVYEDVDSPSPSSPNPVLRLMGKNLMVVNNDENLNHCPNSKCQADPPSNDIHQVTSFYGNKGIDLDLDEYKPTVGGLNRSSLNGPFSPPSYSKVERVEAHLGTAERNRDSIIPKHRKEVIVIDDSTKDEAHADGMNVIETSSGGIPSPLAGYYNSRHLNSFYSYQRSEFSTSRGSHMIPNATSPMPPSSLCPMGWTNSIREDSNILPWNSLTSSQLTNHARSSLYYPPSMS